MAHPLDELVAAALTTDGREPWTMPDDAVPGLESALQRYFGTPGLREAVEHLVRFAYFLDEERASPAAARQLVLIALTARAALAAQGLGVEELLPDERRRCAAQEL